ncbi:hypothetical protein BJ138DRAFT_1107495 [Hygrophoropsis aurantiaca]|uniref:Uncharacterized protein n=1 Tax=Hygrophoropsis aurantiaca TaxID=72124 RepID=A0ACB7ZR20_9AGAM|nr:hypothetical protein BJ138DRAFT_1107495 [Hygrophoropsis aurantiaca]
MSKRTPASALPSSSSKRVKLMDRQLDAQSMREDQGKEGNVLPTQDPRAWEILSGLVDGEYVPVDNALREYLGDRYQYTDWKDIVDRLLAVSDPAVGGDPIAIFTEARDKALKDTNNASQELAGMTMYDPRTGARIGHVAIDTTNCEAREAGTDKQARRRKPQARQNVPRKRRSQRRVSQFLDIEAQHDDDDEDLSDRSAYQRAQLEVGGINHVGLSGWERTVAAIEQRRQPSASEGNAVQTHSSPPVTGDIRSATKTWSVSVPYGSKAFITAAIVKKGSIAHCYPDLNGLIYVMAENAQEIRSLIPSTRKEDVREIKLVSDLALNDVGLGRAPSENTLRVPMWVRCRSGPFKGDLAYLAMVCTETDFVVIKVVPRIAYDPTNTSKKWGEHRALFDRERVESIYELYPIKDLVVEGRRGFRFKGNIYVDGLLCLCVQRTRVERVISPDPDAISLFAETGHDLAFMAATQLAYSKQSWCRGDHVRVVRGEMINTVGEVLSVDIDQWIVTVSLGIEAPRLMELSLDSVRRYYRAGDMVKVLWGAHRDKHGLVDQAYWGDSITFFEQSTQNVMQISVPDWALQSYTPDGRIETASSVQPPSQLLHADDNYEVLKGDHASVIAEEHAGKQGFVHDIYYNQSNEQVVIVELFLPSGALGGNLYSMPRRNIHCSPPRAVVSFTADRGYDVKPRDKVQILRGKHWGSHGIVKSINPVDDVEIEAPFVHVTVIAKGDPEVQSRCLKGRKVMIVGGHYKAYRGTIHEVSGLSYTISLEGLGDLRQVSAEDLVDMATGIRLGGEPLSEAQRQEYLREYERNHAPPPRPRTPNVERPQAETASAWLVDDQDRDDVAGGSSPADESICKNLGGRQVWVKIGSAFVGPSMHNGHGRTKSPSRFLSPEHGQAGKGEVAVMYTPQSGGKPRHVLVPAAVLSPAAPSGIGQECMVLEGEHKGKILKLIRYNKKNKTVSCIGGIDLSVTSVCRVETPHI